MSGRGQPVVLIVEDEAAVATAYRRMLESEYAVRLAANGTEALEKLGDDVDVVLLDRMMPGLQGEEVLSVIRDRGIDCRVAMVTAVEPDLDIVEMGFDAYVQKPPTPTQLRETVRDLLARTEYTTELQEYYAAESKRAALDARDFEEISESREYGELESQIVTLKATLDRSADDLTDDMTFLTVLRSLESDEREEA